MSDKEFDLQTYLNKSPIIVKIKQIEAENSKLKADVDYWKKVNEKLMSNIDELTEKLYKSAWHDASVLPEEEGSYLFWHKLTNKTTHYYTLRGLRKKFIGMEEGKYFWRKIEFPII